ncbi:MAG: hypothetical protein GY941_16385 [Planctomycetes bacterium]|nr:hypothetical protein [Planctomycetota bacterium]
MSDNYVVVDFETTIIDKGSPYDKENSIVCASYKCGKGHKHYTSRPEYHKSNEYGQTVLVERIEQADFWVAHNTKFEYGWLERCGLPLSNTLAFCTLLAEYVLLSNRSKPQKLSLDRCLARRGMASKDSLGKALLGAGVCPSVWPERWLKPYSLQDVVAGEELFLHQRRVLAQQNKLRTLFTRCIFTPPLVDIEKNGMHLDDQRVPILYKNYNNRLGKLRTEIDKITGGANPKSYPQMRKVLYEDLKFALPKDKKWFTAGGEPTTKYEYIETLKPKNKKQRMFKIIKQEYGKVYDALSKSLKKFQDCITQTEDNILTASLNQAVTVTQRLSSTGKNFKAQFQNFARIFKPLFCARYEGWDIGEIDQAQLEYRVAVFLGQDEAGIYDIQHKVDSHTFTADEIFGAKFTVLDDASSERKNYRTKAKAHTFKPLYGGESGTKDEKRYYKAFKEKHKGITKVQNEWKMSAVNTGKVQCPSGLTFYFPGTRILEDGYVTNSTNICNYNVQSFATADIVPIGVTYQWHLMRAAKMESFLVNTIHDSSIGEVHPEEKELYREIGEFAFVDVVYDYLKKVYDVEFNVPLEAECEFNRNWADSESWRREYLK